MTDREFREWLDYHKAGFTGLGKFLASLPTVGGDDGPGRTEVLTRWARCLRDTDLADAKAASDLLFSGEEADPKGYDRHPAAVREIARRITKRKPTASHEPRIIDGVETFACLACCDGGARIVWHPATMKAIWEQTGKVTPYTCAVRCTCAAGKRYRWMREFDPAVDLEPDVWRLEDQLEALRQWMAGGGQPAKPAETYVPRKPVASVPYEQIGLLPEGDQ